MREYGIWLKGPLIVLWLTSGQQSLMRAVTFCLDLLYPSIHPSIPLWKKRRERSWMMFACCCSAFVLSLLCSTQQLRDTDRKKKISSISCSLAQTNEPNADNFTLGTCYLASFVSLSAYIPFSAQYHEAN